MSAVQRFRQGVRALLAFSQPIDYDLAAHYLTPEQLVIFKLLNRSEQLHSLRVLRDVLAQAATTPHDLAVAALMHDAGKSRYRLAIWQKSFAVIVRKVLPGLYHRLSNHDTLTLIHAPFIVSRCHPRWSAQLLAQSGAGERACWLAEHHQDPASNWDAHPYFYDLKRLQRADDTN